MMESNHKFNVTLSDINNEQIRKLLAPIIYLSMLLVIGIPGNLTVFIIYRRRYTKCVYRTIIWNLALVDLIFCSIAIPFNIGRLINYYTFRELWLCKMFTTIIIIFINFSSNLLLLLSVHRFRQVCMPVRTQISTGNVTYWIVVCCTMAVLLTSPHPFLQPLRQVDLGNNLTGNICPVSWVHNSVFSSVYNASLTVIFVIYSTFLFILYSLIGRKIYIQRKITQDTFNLHPQIDDLSIKMTKIAFTISTIFAVSYVPLFAIKLLAVDINEQELNIFQFSTLKIVERSYVINHVANPFIYAIFDKQFRQQFKTLITCPCRCKTVHTESRKVRNNTTSITLSSIQ